MILYGLLDACVQIAKRNSGFYYKITPEDNTCALDFYIFFKNFDPCDCNISLWYRALIFPLTFTLL